MVYIVAGVVVSILSLLPSILVSLSLLFALAILLLLLSLHLHYFFVLTLFQCYRFVSILPILIIAVEPCTIRNLNNLVPSIGILILYDFQNEICTKKYCELIKAVVEIFSV